MSKVHPGQYNVNFLLRILFGSKFVATQVDRLKVEGF